MKQLLLLALFINCATFAQEFNVETITPLSSDVHETSGLIQIEDRLITHNDSGDGPYLYEIDTTDGSVSRTVVIGNASNIDWEDITNDETYIYVGEFGNNSGTRTDLRIYRVLITDYLTTDNDTVFCDTIQFNYSDQISFEPATYTTNYDAEAIIAMNDSLYLFSKNWGDLNSHVYAIPKTPGDYSVSIVDTLFVEGLVTGATYDEEKEEILLVGYSLFDNFLFLIQDFEGSAFSAGNLTKSSPPMEGSRQIEGVTALGAHQYYVSSEKEDENLSILHLVSITNFVSLAENQVLDIGIYPNPTSGLIKINGKFEAYELYNIRGDLLIQSNSQLFDLAELPQGVYFLNFHLENQETFTRKVIKY